METTYSIHVLTKIPGEKRSKTKQNSCFPTATADCNEQKHVSVYQDQCWHYNDWNSNGCVPILRIVRLAYECSFQQEILSEYAAFRKSWLMMKSGLLCLYFIKVTVLAPSSVC